MMFDEFIQSLLPQEPIAGEIAKPPGSQEVPPTVISLDWPGDFSFQQKRVTPAQVNEALGVTANFPTTDLDQSVTCTHQESWDKIIADIGKAVSSCKYEPEVRDCDDYAFGFASLCSLKYLLNSVAVVVDYKAEHAYNIIVMDDRQGGLLIRGYEPQAAIFVELGQGHYDHTSGYTIQF